MLERDYFPLSEEQRLLFRWAGNAPAHMLNLCVRIDIEEEIDEDLFRKALAVTCERLSYSRVRLHDQEDGTTVQYISSMEEQEIPDWTDCTKWSEQKLAGQISRWAGTAFPNKLRDVQLFHAELLRTSTGSTLFFCGLHCVMDIYAVVFFISYLDQVYYALSTGAELPREGGSPKEATRVRSEYLQSERSKKDIEWWKQKFSTEPLFTSFNGLGGHEYIKGKRYGKDRSLLQMASATKSYEIPADIEAKVDQLCREANVSPAMVYLFAVRCYLAGVCETEDVSLRVAFSLRSTLIDKSSGLSRASGFHFRSVLSSDLSFVEGIRETDRIDKDCLKHAQARDIDLTIRGMYDVPAGDVYYSVTYSYVPFVDFKKIHLKLKASQIDSGAAIAPVYILVMHTQQDKGLSMTYQYSTGYINAKNIDRCNTFVMHFLEEGLNHPDISIRELMEKAGL